MPRDVFKALLYGVSAKQETEWGVNWKGLANSLTERFHATENENVKAKIHELMSDLGCPDCKEMRGCGPRCWRCASAARTSVKSWG